LRAAEQILAGDRRRTEPAAALAAGCGLAAAVV
jgi:hypothetical protein